MRHDKYSGILVDGWGEGGRSGHLVIGKPKAHRGGAETRRAAKVEGSEITAHLHRYSFHGLLQQGPGFLQVFPLGFKVADGQPQRELAVQNRGGHKHPA